MKTFYISERCLDMEKVYNMIQEYTDINTSDNFEINMIINNQSPNISNINSTFSASEKINIAICVSLNLVMSFDLDELQKYRNKIYIKMHVNDLLGIASSNVIRLADELKSRDIDYIFCIEYDSVFKECFNQLAGLISDNNLFVNIYLEKDGLENEDIKYEYDKFMTNLHRKLYKTKYSGLLYPVDYFIISSYIDRNNTYYTMDRDYNINQSAQSSEFITLPYKVQLNQIFNYIAIEGKNALAKLVKKRSVASNVNTLSEHLRKTKYDMYFVSLHRDNKNYDRPSLGALYIKQYVSQYGYSSICIDARALDLREYIDIILKKTNNYVIGFYCAEDNKNMVANTIRYIKADADIRVVVGGPQAYILDSAFISATGCDVISYGEGEKTIKQLLDYYIKDIGCLSDIKGIKFMKGDEYIENDPQPLIEDLDSLPIIDHTDYPEGYKASIITGRGCPYNCGFCFEGSTTKKVRYRSIENVMSEIRNLLGKRPETRNIYILDDTFTLNKERIFKFCEKIREIRDEYHVGWLCEAHVETLYKNPGMIKEMVRSGCTGMQIGIESASDEVLAMYNKKTNTSMIKKVVEYCKENGLLNLEGNFIVGGPNDSPEILEKTIEFAKTLLTIGGSMLHLNMVHFWPYPLTPITKNPDKYGITIDKKQTEYSLLSLENAVVSTQQMSRLDIIEAKKRFDREIADFVLKLSYKIPKMDIINLYDFKARRFGTSNFWSYTFTSLEHISNYFYIANKEFFKEKDETELLSCVPIRTFSMLEYKDDSLVYKDMVFDELSRYILENSTGQKNVAQLMEGMDKEKFIKCLIDLEDRCFIYYTFV